MKKTAVIALYSCLGNALKIITGLVCFLVMHLTGNSQWRWLNPKPSGYTNQKVVFTTHKMGYILQSNGDLFKTTDVGNRWQLVGNFGGAQCMDIRYGTGVIGCLNGVVYVSNDSGNTWKKVNTVFGDVLATVNIVSRDTFFLSNKGYGFSVQPAVYKTNDRGKNFTLSHVGVAILSIAFANSKIGYIGAAQGTILKTTDGGATWQQKRQLNTIPSGILSMKFINADTGFAFQEYNNLLVTHDGGETWASTSTYSTGSIFDMQFVNNNDGYMVGEYGSIQVTHDGGATVQPAYLKNIDDSILYSVYFISKDTGFVVGQLGRIMKTTDGGANWSYFSQTYNDVTGIDYPTPTVAYFATGNHVYKSIDKGENWQLLNLTTGVNYGSNSSFQKMHFISPDTGFITTSQPVLLNRTFDGGATWDTVNPSKYGWENIADMQFLTRKLGYMSLLATGNGLILKTKDGGLSWTTAWQAQYFGESFGKIFFVNEATGYAFRYSKMYKTTDSAKNWHEISLPGGNYSTLTTVHFTNAARGIITDDSGGMYLTNDSCKTWKRLDGVPYESFGLTTMQFFNPKVGYLSNKPYLYQTTDSGITWQLTLQANVTSIIFTSDSNVVVAGNGGTIVTSSIKTAKVSSLSASSRPCVTSLGATVAAVLVAIDSIYFDITAQNGKTISLPALPKRVSDSVAECVVNIDSLKDGDIYTAKVRYKVDGKLYYSDSITFAASGRIIKPVITRSDNILISSYPAGNQWYVNDTIINYAIGQSYIIHEPLAGTQCFAVQTTAYTGCSAMSDKLCLTQAVLADDGLNINAANTQAGVSVTWKLNSANTSYFVVERSFDGRNFITLGNKPAEAGTSYYNFIDAPALLSEANKIFYRVVAYNKNGDAVYSNVAMVNIRDGNSIIISPNPAATIATVYLKMAITNAVVNVYNLTGKKVYTTTLKGAAQNKCSVPVNNLPAGIYTVTVETSNENYSGRLVIAR